MARNNFRLAFQLSKIGEEIAHEHAKNAGLIKADGTPDFNKYFDKILFKAMQDHEAETNLNKSYRISRKTFRRPVIKNRYQFIQGLASKKETTVSRVIEVLLVKGLE